MSSDQSERERILSDFDRSARLTRPVVEERYGNEAADELYRSARAHLEEIIPLIPHLEGARARSMKIILEITAQEVAFYKALEARGGTPAEAWEICHEAIRLRMAEFPSWKRLLMQRFMFSRFVRRVMRRREREDERGRFGGFDIHYLAGDGEAFDIGIDYHGCGNLELAKKAGAEAFAPYLCMSDIALGEALGWGLTRTQTLADGCSHCDFRFKKGAPPRISSRTLEVQETIERIARRESGAELEAIRRLPIDHEGVGVSRENLTEAK